jgi:hypothetical protein
LPRNFDIIGVDRVQQAAVQAITADIRRRVSFSANRGWPSLAVEERWLPGVQTFMKVAGASATSVGDVISRFAAAIRLDDIALLKTRIVSALDTTKEAARRASAKFLDRIEMRKLTDYRIEVGNHSTSNSHVRGLLSNELDLEIGQSRRPAAKPLGPSRTILSIRCGGQLDATHEAVATARASGHQAMFLVHTKAIVSVPHEDTA